MTARVLSRSDDGTAEAAEKVMISTRMYPNSTTDQILQESGEDLSLDTKDQIVQRIRLLNLVSSQPSNVT